MGRKINRRGDTTRRNANSVKQSIKRRKKEKQSPVEFIGSGSTTLNLALSGYGPKGGWARARIVNIVGDGSSGKTVLALEAAFWVFTNILKVVSQIFKKVTKFDIVYNNVEGAMDFPITDMYGRAFNKKVTWCCSKTVEHMGRDVLRRISKLEPGHHLLYIIDSWDALGTEAGEKRMDKSIKEDTEQGGSYQLEKQKFASDWFRYLSKAMQNNRVDATVIIISQVRTKIGATFGKKTYRAGGKALDFYTHQVAWIREVEKMRHTKSGQKRVTGIKSEVKVERSKVAKPFRESEFTILYDYGLDDIDSMIDYIWGKGTINFQGKEFGRKRFIKYIEENGLEEELQKETEKVWHKIEQSFKDDVLQRKKRF